MNRIRLYQRLTLVSALILALLGHFAFGWVSFFVPFARAAAVVWVGPSSGNWNQASNWSSGIVPTSDDDVIIASTTPIIVTVPVGTFADFSTLTIDASSVVSASPATVTGLQLIGDIGTAGDITLRGPGNYLAGTGNIARLQQVNQNTQSISGTLTIESGGLLLSGNNGTTQIYSLDFFATDIDIQPGGAVSGYANGFDNGIGDNDGSGPGKGIRGIDPSASGASHAGNGGQDSQGDPGGVGYCDFENPTTLGSGGGGSGAHGVNEGSGGSGGSHVSLVAINELTINGIIKNSGVFHSGGGGGGGSTILSADIISGTPQLITSAGGNGGGNPNTPLFSGGGGGGCVKVSYGTSIAFDPTSVININGGAAQATNPIYDTVIPQNPPSGAVYQAGGAGTLFVQKQDDSIRKLYVFNTTTPNMQARLGAETPQAASLHTFQTLAVNSSSVYVIGNGKTLVLTDTHPFDGSSASGTVKIEAGGTLKIDANAVIDNITLELHEGGAISDNTTDLSSTLNLTIGAGGTLDMRDFTTTSQPFELNSLTIESGGIVTHGSHSGLGNTQAHMVNIKAVNITIASGGLVDASGKGFSGGDSSAVDGYGPGGGEYVGDFYQSGGGHGSNGGLVGNGGGGAYCDLSDPSTLGSGGASAEMVSSTTGEGYGGSGGGLVWLNAEDTLIIEGSISVGGGAGGYFATTTYTNGGGGAGGAIKITARTVTGTPEEINIRGAWQGLGPGEGVVDHLSVGGGGCMLVEYRDSSSITSSTVQLGNNDTTYAEEGVFNSVPVVRNISLISGMPTLIGQTIVSSTINVSPFQIKVADNYAYIVSALTNVGTGNTRGIYIADISDPSHPTVVQSMVTSTIGSRVDIVGNYLYTVNGSWSGTANQVGSFQVIDISNPLSPILLGNIVSSTQLAYANGVYVSGNYAFVITGSPTQNASFSGVRVIDISDQNHPTIVGNFSDPSYLFSPLGAQVVGDYLYVASGGSNSVQIIDISNPLSLFAVGSIQDAVELAAINKIAVKGDYAYVTSFTGDFLRIIDIADPLNMRIAGGIEGEIDGPNALSLYGNYAFVSGQIDDTIHVIDISNPPSSTVIHTVTFARLDGTRSNYVADGYLYTAGSVNSGSEYLSVFDIRNPSLSFQAEDMDKTLLSMKAEYVPGSCTYSEGSYATFSTSTATSTYGTVSIDNSAVNNRRIQNISTTQNRNNVTSTWLTMTDIPGIEGEYCMFVSAYDGVSESRQATSTVMLDLDTVSPSTPNLSFTKTQTSITLFWDSVAGAKYYTVSSSISNIQTKTTENSVTFAGLNNSNTYTFQIAASDSFENDSAYSSPLDITPECNSPGGSNPIPDPPPPPSTSTTTTSTFNNPSGLILINNGDVYTRSRSVMLFFNSSFVDAYAISVDGDFTGKSYFPIVSSTPYTLPVGEGEKKVYARFTNQFGTYEAFDVILLDSIPPPIPTASIVQSGLVMDVVSGKYVRKNTSSTEMMKPVITGKAEPGSRIVITLTSGISLSSIQLAQVRVFYASSDSNGDWSFAFPSNLDNTVLTLSVQSEDVAGNISEPVKIYIDLSVPEIPMPCTTNCEPVEPPVVVPPCTIDCEPIEPPITVDTPCTVNCGTEPEIPDTTGNGTGTTEENGEGNGSGGDTSGSTSESDGENIERETVIERVPNSIQVVKNVVYSFFDEVGESIRRIPGLAPVFNVVGEVVKKTQEVIDDPVVESANEVVVVPVIAVMSTVNVATGGASLFAQIMVYLRLIFSQPFLLLKRRHQKKWGVVFNAYTKRPLDLAMVRLIEVDTNRTVRTQVTDMQGRFFMTAPAGDYVIEVQKEGFRMRATKIKEDSMYPNIYQGGSISITEDKSEINYNIPFEPIIENQTTKHLISEYGKTGLQKSISTVGVVATACSLFISPKPWITVLLIFHLALYLCIKRISRRKIKGVYAVVTDSKTKKPIGGVLIRVFDVTYNKLVDSTMTNIRGKYAVLVGPSTYYITAEKEGFVIAQSGIIDFSSEKTNGVGGVIAENISLSSIVDVDRSKKIATQV